MALAYSMASRVAHLACPCELLERTALTHVVLLAPIADNLVNNQRSVIVWRISLSLGCSLGNLIHFHHNINIIPEGQGRVRGCPGK